VTKGITFLIPTHCRAGYLRRALAYYGGAGVDIAVADSSPQAYSGQILGPVRYFHCPGQAFMAKLASVAEQIRTPYVLFCADDDFTVPRAVEACLAFLEEHPDYVTAQGDFYSAEARADGAHLARIYPQADQVCVDSNSPLERLQQVQDPYIPSFYSVQRTTLLRDYVLLAGNGLENYNMLELFSAMLAAIHGKHKQLPLFYGVREAVPSQAPKDPRRRDGVEVVSRESRYASEYSLVVERAAALLTRLHDVPPETAREAVRASVERFVSRYCIHTPRRTFLQKLPKYARRLTGALTGAGQAERQAEARQEELAMQVHFSAYDQSAASERDAILRLVAAGVA
jgi:glycosyltransferase domain-containing protein